MITNINKMATAFEIATRAFEEQYYRLDPKVFEEMMERFKKHIRLDMGVRTMKINSDATRGQGMGKLTRALMMSRLQEMGFTVSEEEGQYGYTHTITPAATPPEGSLGWECQRASALAQIDPTTFYYDKVMRIIEPKLTELEHSFELIEEIGYTCTASALDRVVEDLEARGFRVDPKGSNACWLGEPNNGREMKLIGIYLSAAASVRAVKEVVERKKKQKMEVEDEAK